MANKTGGDAGYTYADGTEYDSRAEAAEALWEAGRFNEALKVVIEGDLGRTFGSANKDTGSDDEPADKTATATRTSSSHGR